MASLRGWTLVFMFSVFLVAGSHNNRIQASNLTTRVQNKTKPQICRAHGQGRYKRGGCPDYIACTSVNCDLLFQPSALCSRLRACLPSRRQAMCGRCWYIHIYLSAMPARRGKGFCASRGGFAVVARFWCWRVGSFARTKAKWTYIHITYIRQFCLPPVRRKRHPAIYCSTVQQ